MNIRHTLKNIIYAFSAQAISLCMSVLMSLIVPKLLGVQEYSYWQLFLFYSSYAGFCHLGFNDGLYLRLGGQTYKQLDKRLISTQIKIMMLFQIIISALIAIFSFTLIDDSNRTFVITCAAIYLIIYNLSGCVNYIFQAVNQTKIFSISTMIDRTFFIAAVLIMLFVKVDSFKYFIVLYLIARSISLLYCVIKGKELIFSRLYNIKEAFHEIWVNISVGIKLMIANIASMLILGIGRQITDMVWGIEAFGKFSFSLSLTNFFLLFISQVSMVLFPALRRSSEKELKGFYNIARTSLGLLLPIVFIAYEPIKLLLEMWLPQYGESIRYLALLLPLCTFDGKMSLLCNTYFKVLRKEKMLLYVNIMSMIISLCLSFVGAYLLKNIYFIVVSMIISIAIRSIVSEIYLAKLMNSRVIFSITTEVILAGVFMITAWFMKPIPACMIFIFAYIVFLIINKNKVKYLIGKLKALKGGSMQ